MRAVTLSDPGVAEVIGREFACAWERKGTVWIEKFLRNSGVWTEAEASSEVPVRRYFFFLSSSSRCFASAWFGSSFRTFS